MNLVNLEIRGIICCSMSNLSKSCYLENIKFPGVSGICFELIFHKKVLCDLGEFEKQIFSWFENLY